jgi:hypothetical protein
MKALYFWPAMVVACSGIPEEVDTRSSDQAVVSKASEPQNEVGDGPYGERPGLPPVSFRWDDEPSSRVGSTLAATVTNNSETETFTVTVAAHGGGPTELLRKLVMGRVELPAGASEKVTIDVDSLPVQSAGVWASIVLVGTYLRTFDSGLREQAAATEVLHVTSDAADWSAPAVIRSGPEQDRVDTALLRAGVHPRPTRLRVLDDESQQVSFRSLQVESLTTVYGYSVSKDSESIPAIEEPQ